MKRVSEIFLMIVFVICFVSCSSLPGGTKGNFIGLILDENNKPVSDYKIRCNKQGMVKTAVSSKEGVFVIQNVSSGVLEVSGEKENFEYLKRKVSFFDRNQTFCFKVFTADGVFDNADKNLIMKNYDSAEMILKNLKCSKKTNVGLLKEFYLKEIKTEGGLNEK